MDIFTEKQHRLLVEPLYASWPGPGPGRSFLAVTDVGYFWKVGELALVPDMMLSLDLGPVADLHAKDHRSYFRWLVGKAPEVVVEIISDRSGGEETHKM